MSTPRLTTRTLVFNGDKILLVRNKNANFWYPPGGGMEATDKNLPACAEREVLEETGLTVKATSLAWVREFYDEDKQQMNLETFWIAEPTGDGTLSDDHTDKDAAGEVGHVGWFTEAERKKLTVYPKIVAETSFDEMKSLESRYLAN